VVSSQFNGDSQASENCRAVSANDVVCVCVCVSMMLQPEVLCSCALPDSS
jgi:hypothetical protein